MVYSLLRVYTLANCYMKRRSVYVVQADAVTMVSEGIYIYIYHDSAGRIGYWVCHLHVCPWDTIIKGRLSCMGSN